MKFNPKKTRLNFTLVSEPTKEKFKLELYSHCQEDNF